MLLDFDFNWYRFLVVTIWTLLIAYVTLKNRSLIYKLFFGLLIFFVYIYSGIGAANEYIYNDYYLYYCAYVAFLMFGIKLFSKKNITAENLHSCHQFEFFFNKYGKFIIGLYVLLMFIDLLYPNIKIQRLISPPSPDLSFFSGQFQSVVERSLISQCLYLLKQITFPFFICSLYIYRNNIKKIIFIIVLIIYLNYCAHAYMGRGDFMIYVLFVLLILYVYNPLQRKKIVKYCLLIILPLSIIGLSVYQVMRMGESVGGIGLSSIVDKMFMVELNFPQWFESVVQHRWKLSQLTDYISWLLFLPFPIDPNLWEFDPGVNYKITELVTGTYRGEPFFSVVLGGLVTEGVYVFNKFFFLHALLSGVIISIAYNSVFKYKETAVLGLYLVASVGYELARGGTSSVFPMIIKILLYFWIIMFFVKKSSKIIK